MKANHLKTALLGTTLLVSIGMPRPGVACPYEGRITHFNITPKTVTANLDSGYRIETGKKSIYSRMLKYAFDSEQAVCVTNTWNDDRTETTLYPKQMVARIDLSNRSPSKSRVRCVKAGYIERVYVNANYDWFHLEDGFSVRVIHRSKLTDLLYRAAFTKRQVCITRMNLDGSGPEWGIPRALHIVE